MKRKFQLATAASLAFLFAAPSLRAEYIVLRNGQRLKVTSYEFLEDNHYRLQMMGGIVVIQAEDVVGIEPEEVFEPNPPPLTNQTPFHEIIRKASDKYGVDADLIHCIIAVESNFNPKAISKKNARGLMQLMPGTASKLGVKNVFDPLENVQAGTQYLSEMLRRYDNNLALALAAYNAGPERVEQFGRRVPPYPETLLYVRRITLNYNKLKSTASGRSTSGANGPAISLTP